MKWITMAVLALLLAGCGQQPQVAAEGMRVAAEDVQFLSDNQAWRIERHSALVQADGWTSLVGLHWLTLKAHYIGSSPTSGLRLAYGPERLGLVQREQGRVWFTPERGVDVRVDGHPVSGRIELLSDRSPQPTVLRFDQDKGAISLLERGGQHALRVRHADAPTRTGFAGLDYWPADRRWAKQARLEPHRPARTLEVVDMVGMASRLPNPGRLVFEHDGRSQALEAIGNPDGSLLVILADRTSGHGSYAAGRYLDVPAPAADGSVLLDFNRAYNPPCAFTPYATCPLPPAENRLDLAVEAGEKAYHPRDAAAEAQA